MATMSEGQTEKDTATQGILPFFQLCALKWEVKN